MDGLCRTQRGTTGRASTPIGLAGGFLAARQFSTDQDSHDDFKPQVKAAAAGDVEQTIEKDINSHDVFIYMKVPVDRVCFRGERH